MRLLGVDQTMPWDLEGYPTDPARWAAWREERQRMWPLVADSLSPEALKLIHAGTIGLDDLVGASEGQHVLPGEVIGLPELRTERYDASLELFAGIKLIAGGLAARGFGPGSTLGLMAPNIPEYAIVFHAVAMLGATGTTVNPMYTGYEIAHQLADAGAQLRHERLGILHRPLVTGVLLAAPPLWLPAPPLLHGAAPDLSSYKVLDIPAFSAGLTPHRWGWRQSLPPPVARVQLLRQGGARRREYSIDRRREHNAPCCWRGAACPAQKHRDVPAQAGTQ